MFKFGALAYYKGVWWVGYCFPFESPKVGPAPKVPLSCLLSYEEIVCWTHGYTNILDKYKAITHPHIFESISSLLSVPASNQNGELWGAGQRRRTQCLRIAWRQLIGICSKTHPLIHYHWGIYSIYILQTCGTRNIFCFIKTIRNMANYLTLENGLKPTFNANVTNINNCLRFRQLLIIYNE